MSQYIGSQHIKIIFTRTTDENYEIAHKQIENVEKEVCAIYCVPKSPKQRKLKSFVKYFSKFNSIDEYILELQKKYDEFRFYWIIGIYNIETFDYLLERIKTLINHEVGKEVIKKGLFKIKALDLIGVGNFMPINFQIVDRRYFILGYQVDPIGAIGVEQGFAGENEKIADSLYKYFIYLWINSIEIIECENCNNWAEAIKIDNLKKLYYKVCRGQEHDKISSKLGLIEHLISGNAILFDVTDELISSFRMIKERILPSFDVIKSRFLNYAPHDKEHAERVANTCIIKIFYDIENLFKLNSLERFILYTSAWCHDIGMGLNDEDIKRIIKERLYKFLVSSMKSSYNWEHELNKLLILIKDGNRDKNKIEEVKRLIRKYHAILSGSYILMSYGHFNLNYDLAECIAKVVAAHSKKFDINSLPIKININNKNIHLRFLAAILRLADALDLEYRVNAEKYDWLKIHRNEPDQTKHWAYKLLIGKVEIKYDEKNKNAGINIKHYAVNEEELNGLIAFEGVNLAEELLSIRDILKNDHKDIKIPINFITFKNKSENILKNFNKWKKMQNEINLDEIAKKIVNRLHRDGVIRGD